MVTKLAWARLTIPPMPVTSTKDRKMSPRAKPLVVRLSQKASASTKM